MVKFIKLNVVIGAIFIFASCATSMTPTEVNETLPTLTKSTFISQVKAEEAIKSNRCKLLVKGRKYNAPIALSVKGDLRNGAKGIDEWVESDGGNSYSLVNYEWVTVDHMGSTQLQIKFDTMLCD